MMVGILGDECSATKFSKNRAFFFSHCLNCTLRRFFVSLHTCVFFYYYYSLLGTHHKPIGIGNADGLIVSVSTLQKSRVFHLRSIENGCERFYVELHRLRCVTGTASNVFGFLFVLREYEKNIV